MKRYGRDRRIRGNKRETAKTMNALRRAHELGLVTTYEVILQESQRLDHLAYEYLGDDKLWWVLAALSNIGWALQLPPGTVIKIPNDITKIRAIAG